MCLIDCLIVFYVVKMSYVCLLFKLLIMSVSNLLITFLVGNGGELKFFL